VKATVVDFYQQSALVTYDSGLVDVAQLVDAVNRAGFRAGLPADGAAGGRARYGFRNGIRGGGASDGK
jgi:hypothetical protein